MSGDKDFEKKVKELDDVYEQMADSLELENITFLYGSWVKVFRREQRETPYRALSNEKIAALELALADFEAVYEAEKAEAAKMPLSWAEAERLRKVFDRIFHEKNEPPPAAPVEH